MRQDGSARQQAGQPAGLVAKGMEKRVDDQVAITWLQANHPHIFVEGAHVLAVGAHHPLGLAGGTGGKQQIGQILGANRLCALAGVYLTDCRALGEERRPVQVRCLLWLALAEQHQLFEARRAQRRQHRLIVQAQKRALHQQYTGLAARENIGHFGAFHARVDRYQHRSGAMHAQRSYHPVTAVRCPDRHPVARLDPQCHQATAYIQRQPWQRLVISDNAVLLDSGLIGKAFGTGEQQGGNRQRQRVPGMQGAQ